MRLRFAYLAPVLVLAATWVPAQQLPPDVACRGCGAGAPRGFASLNLAPRADFAYPRHSYEKTPELRLIVPPFPAQDHWSVPTEARNVSEPTEARNVAARRPGVPDSTQRIAHRAARLPEQTRRSSQPTGAGTPTE